LERAHGGAAARIVLIAHVQREGDFAGNDIAGAGFDFKFSNRGRNAAAFDGDQKLCRARQRIMSQIHRHGSGVSGDAVKLHTQTALPRDGRDDTHGQIFPIKHRPLLDVNLGKA
jgi:hypothetical protein